MSIGRSWCVSICVALWLASVAPAAALELHMLDPRAGEVSAADVLSGRIDRHFSVPLSTRVALEPSRQPRWFRLEIDAAEQTGEQVLTVARLPMRELEVYLPTPAGGYTLESRSFFAPDAEHFSPSTFIFDLPDALPPNAPVYLCVEHGGRLFLGIDVMPAADFYRHERTFVAAITAGFMTIAVMLLVNLVFLLALRERLYAYYVAFLASQMAWVLFASGIAFVLPGVHVLGQYPGSLSGTLLTLANALMLQFARHFADLPTRHPLLDRALRALLFAFLALALGFVLPVEFPHRWVGTAASAVFAMLPVLLLFVMLQAWRAGSRSAGLFLLAWLPLGAFGAYRTLISFGGATPSLLTMYAPLFAVALESVVLSLALAWRMLGLRIQRDRAQYLADYDVLTGGLARRAGEQRLHSLFTACMAHGRAFSIAFFDLDHLKTINDVHGHSAGDACLHEIGARVSAVVGDRGQLVRWGGDEFLLLLPDCSPARAREIVTSLCAAIRAQPLDHRGTELALGISAGVASAAHQDSNAQAMLERADRALYAAKRQGRGRVVASDASEPGRPLPA